MAAQMLNQVIGVADLLGAGHRRDIGHLEDLRRAGGRARERGTGDQGLDLSMHGEEGYNLEA